MSKKLTGKQLKDLISEAFADRMPLDKTRKSLKADEYEEPPTSASELRSQLKSLFSGGPDG